MSIKRLLAVMALVLLGMALYSLSREDWNNAGISVTGLIVFTVVLLVWEGVEKFMQRRRSKP